MLNDYIRRSDVLKLFDEWGGGFAYIEIETDGAIEYVKNLPGIGHCRDCEYFKERDGEALPPARKRMTNKEAIETIQKMLEVNKNDLISRSKAIRWVKAECNPYGQPTLDYEAGIKVIEHLERMPSEQAEKRSNPQGRSYPKM